ncbi:MAG: helix-turn-helix domain-containing protein [Mangrovibacterium sp.]
MKELSFDSLPLAVQELNSRLIRIEHLLKGKSENSESDQWLDLDQLVNYLPGHPAKQTIYGLVSNRKIPFHKRGKRLIFSKKSIDLWIEESRQKTVDEIRNEI